MTIFVGQRCDSDCAIAAIAMALDYPYEVVLDLAGDEYNPDKGTRHIGRILKAAGLSDKFERGEPAGDFVCLHRPWGVAPELLRRMIWGRRALVTVPSLNIDGGAHMVYFDGREVHDPNQPHKIRYGCSEYGLLEPSEVVLFREGQL